MRRLQAILAGTLILFGNLKGLAGTQCAVHEAPRTAQVAQPHSGHSHASHSSPSDKSHHESCTCLDHCRSCQSVGLVAAGPRIQETAFYADAAAGSAAPVSRIASRVAFQLPFATAPPAIV